jgi:hypothetical protein
LAYEIASSIEQASALFCNSLAATYIDERTVEDLRLEMNSKLLKGRNPQGAPSIEDLDKLPKLDSFFKEVMRMSPPARPARRVLDEPLEVGGRTLPAGTVVAPEPFVSHFDPSVYTRPDNFVRSRFEGVSCEDAPLIPFATSAKGKLGCISEDGEKFLIAIVKNMYLWMLRVFEDPVRIESDADRQESKAWFGMSGYPVYTIARDNQMDPVSSRYFYEKIAYDERMLTRVNTVRAEEGLPPKKSPIFVTTD